MAAYNLHNYSASDEMMEMIIAGAFKALFHDVGFDVTSENLANGCPSQWTFAWAEFNLAVDCLMKVLQEIKDNGAKTASMMTDHGHRGGKDHFIVLLVWSGLDENQNQTLSQY